MWSPPARYPSPVVSPGARKEQGSALWREQLSPVVSLATASKNWDLIFHIQLQMKRDCPFLQQKWVQALRCSLSMASHFQWCLVTDRLIPLKSTLTLLSHRTPARKRFVCLEASHLPELHISPFTGRTPRRIRRTYLGPVQAGAWIPGELSGAVQSQGHTGHKQPFILSSAPSSLVSQSPPLSSACSISTTLPKPSDDSRHMSAKCCLLEVAGSVSEEPPQARPTYRLSWVPSNQRPWGRLLCS